MKTIIAGSREGFEPEDVVQAVYESGLWGQITEVVSGCAQGVDSMGELWAKINRIPVRQFPADWNANGKRAGILRNIEMAKYADALIAIWDGESRGTAHMVEEASKRGLRLFVYNRKKAHHQASRELQTRLHDT